MQFLGVQRTQSVSLLSNICLGLCRSRVRHLTHPSLLRHDCAYLKWQGFTTASLRFFSVDGVLCRVIFVNTKVSETFTDV